ncbi:thioredoxin family protein [Thiohalomonas denitrificans]|uniref:thioredoxin family protein n=1 Tax=Thiohalomonas denitrificans TaxID=415747 RepID=UPI0026F12B48|nr:thioredoxin domain-containing protein [Thiohalomonas denitrificans]
MSDKSPFIFDADVDNFNKTVIEASREVPILVDFTADWCGPCLSLGPILERVIPEYQGAIILAKVDADENMKLCGHYGLRGFPTVLLFRDSEEVERFSGAQSPSFVRDFIERNID